MPSAALAAARGSTRIDVGLAMWATSISCLDQAWTASDTYVRR
jgi:hypothetical protein